MDEALSAVKMKSISKPMEVEILEKKLRTLEIELEAKKAENPHLTSPLGERDSTTKNSPLLQRRGVWGEGVLEKLEKDIASTKEQVQTLVSAWKKEKDLIVEIKTLREKIDSLKIEADNFERQGNFGEVARIRYGEIPEVEKKIVEAEEKLKELHKNGQSFLRDRVDAEDIAEIISKWTGIPATKLLETEKEKLLKMEDFMRKRVI
jgi:ATP-dependent Clp protease ATP-binding subunit ClpB